MFISTFGFHLVRNIGHGFIRDVLHIADASQICGSVQSLCWTPDGCALAMAWQRGGYSIWSVFGALLLCSIGAESSLGCDISESSPLHISSMEWGSEGYHLWMVAGAQPSAAACSQTGETAAAEASNKSSHEKQEHSSHQLLQMQFVKSSLTVNPCSVSISYRFIAFIWMSLFKC